MKKSILLGALAFVAISAMSIQNVNAQVKEEKKEAQKTVKMAEKEQAPAATMQEPVKQKKGDCCAEKKVSEKKDSKDCCADKTMKEEKKNVKAEGKRVRPKDAVKRDTKRTKKASVKSSKTEN